MSRAALCGACALAVLAVAFPGCGGGGASTSAAGPGPGTETGPARSSTTTAPRAAKKLRPPAGVASVRECAARWNREATRSQRAHVGLAAVVSPLRRDMPAGAWVGGWPLAPARAQEAGGAGAAVVLRRDECLVVTGTDTGLAYVRVPGRGWVRVSADTPYDPPWFLSAAAARGAIAFVRRDGTVVPVGGP